LPRLFARLWDGAENRRLRELAATRTEAMQFVGHEIRTPLAVVRGYLSMIRDGSLGPVTHDAAGVLAQMDGRLAEIEELAAQLIEASRMADAGTRLRQSRFDLREVVCEVVERAGSVQGRDAVQLRGVAHSVPIVADEARLRMVVANLIDNAFKYSPGQPEITCTLDADASGVRVLVSDHGVGLDPGQIEQLFKPYSRLTRSDGLGRPGLGLGLYLAREVARAHGGELDAWPNPDTGSTFRLTLPAG
jgi:signal transduction histidine kinase